jgi:REP element-mobilizing transposase RayT
MNGNGKECRRDKKEACGSPAAPSQSAQRRVGSPRAKSPNWEGRLPSRPVTQHTNLGDLEVAASSQTNLGASTAATLNQTEPPFLDKWKEVRQQQNRLPHWQQDGRTYFVTFHLADSIPRSKLEEWITERDAWLKWNSPPWSEKQRQEYLRRFVNTVERWLDAGDGSCVLRNSSAALIVGQAFQHFQGTRCQHYAWVVMPNHVHLLFSTCPGQDLPDLLRDWKGYTSRRINRLLDRSESLWQKDYFDRLVRNSDHFWNCARYIRNNSLKARLSSDEYLLYENDFVRQGLDWEGRLPSRPLNKKEGGDLEVAAPSHKDHGGSAATAPI